jgi:hypothetical protein
MPDASNTNVNLNTEDINVALGTKSDAHNDHTPEKAADAQALGNAGKAAGNCKETAVLVLRGYPLLKAKTTVEVTGVGKGSGVWYCKTVVQQWHVEHGYLTNAQLMKGKGGGGGGQGGGGAGDNDDTGQP